MVNYNLDINVEGKKFSVKYTPLKKEKEEYPDVDENKQPLTWVKGSATRGHWENSKGEVVAKRFKLIKNEARTAFSGRIKEANGILVPENEAGDLLTESNYLVLNEELYKYLKENEKAIKVGVYFGGNDSFKASRGYVYPDKNFKGYCRMSVGSGSASEVIGEKLAEFEEGKRLAEKLKQVELEASKINQVKVEDLI